MITIKRNAILNWSYNPSTLQIVNQKALVSLSRKLGTALGPVNTMLSRAEEMEMLLPEILGTSPNSNATDWQARLESYWHNFYLDVPPTGITFDTSLTFDMSDYKRKENIKELKEELGIKDTKDIEKLLANHITKNVPEERRYKYMSPVNITDYLAWRYCLLSSEVANDPDDIIKSVKIRFYLIDEGKLKAKKEGESKVKKDAIAKYSHIISSDDSESIIENLLIASNKILSLKELKNMTISDKESMLLDSATSDPKLFIDLSNDTLSSDKAEIKKWVMAGLVRQLSNTTIYVDASDPKMLLGNTIEEVIAYVNNEINAAYINQLRLKFKSL